MKLYATLEINDSLLDDREKLKEVIKIKLEDISVYFLDDKILDEIIEKYQKKQYLFSPKGD